MQETPAISYAQNHYHIYTVFSEYDIFFHLYSIKREEYPWERRRILLRSIDVSKFRGADVPLRNINNVMANTFYCIIVYSCALDFTIWAPSSEFVSSSIPSWQILTAHAQPFRGARDLAFCLKVSLDSLLVWSSSEGSGETARMRRLAWTFAARIGDKYQIRLTRSIWFK